MVDAHKTGVRIFDNGRKIIDKSQIELQNDEWIATQRKSNQGIPMAIGTGIKNVFLQIEEIASFLRIKTPSAFHRSTL